VTADARTLDERLVLRFFAAWDSSDPDLICSFLTPDVHYSDQGLPAREGIEGVREHLTRLFPSLHVRIETVHIASCGGVVLTERFDYLRVLPYGKEVKLAVMGALEVVGGKIAAFRDYSDLRTSEAALAQASGSASAR